ncbi:MAG: sigma 54-interacting transcriptional regulator, partial [Polyangiales bacterium]
MPTHSHSEDDDDELTTKHVDPRLAGQLSEMLGRSSELHLVAMDLLVVDGPDAGQQFRLDPGTSRLGTSAGCQVRLTDKTVSRVHCELELQRSSVRVVDDGSTNGTTIDGVPIQRADLRPGPLLRVGSSSLRLQRSDEPLVVPLSKLDHFGDASARLLGRSVEMRRIYAILERAARSDVTVLVQGETGTGKDVVARALHAASPRKGGPFVAIDCGSIAENLIESELFGHARGAFSGAVGERTGLFEEANGGTLFLDEVGELPIGLQPKLLRALETREVRRVGSNLARKVDVRIVAATNRPLGRAVNEGTFREDLFYRLAVVEVHLPPLRARRDDIPALAQHFHDRITGSPSPLPEGLLRSMSDRGWPGNVRELRNFVERIVSLGWMPASPEGPEVPSGAKPVAIGPPPDLAPLISTELPLKEAREAWNERFEQLYLRALLARTGGNVRRAAELAGVN